MPTYGVDSIIANVSSITGISFEYVQLGAKQILWNKKFNNLKK